MLAARRIQAYFHHMPPRSEMTESMIERISEQIDRSCRVVAQVPAPGFEDRGGNRIPAVH